MGPRFLFLIAYVFSGGAGLVYQVSWTRLLGLHLGHSTAAASTVVAAFMGGLAAGSALGGRIAPRLTRRQALYAYVLLEAIVISAALIVPLELTALQPGLAWAYQDGRSRILFPVVRLLACLAVISIPAVALGATFPMAVRWFVSGSAHPGQGGGQLYAANTIGAALGVLVAAFVLIPAMGISGTTLIGVAASGSAMAIALLIAQRERIDPGIATDKAVPAGIVEGRGTRADARRDRRRHISRPEISHQPKRYRLAATVLALTGFASFMYEIAWTRVLSLVMGPTTYAFAATLAAIITGLACGSAFGSWLASRTRRPAFYLALALAGTAIATTWATTFVGVDAPRLVARQLVGSPYLGGQLLTRHALLVAELILPTAIGFGIAFPLALEMVDGQGPLARRLGIVYGINTLAALAGSLVAGFVAIPAVGLRNTLQCVSLVLVIDAMVVLAWGTLSRYARVLGVLPALLGLALIIRSPPWDVELLASGVYKYALHVPQDQDPETALKAGTLLYYRDGAASTVSVKRRAGTLSLSVDGKVDASNSSDMLTQMALGHLPLLVHPRPRDVLVVGLGSGVTAASALLHPITKLDIVEISPEVIEASEYFAAENRHALDDSRTRLIRGDGRTHLLLSSRKYDVIVSEPSNPWMAGVAALFTREFLIAARERLAPEGIICQWAHTYDISDADLRSIVATFLSVFPHGTMWVIGEGDVLLVASTTPLDARIENIDRAWPPAVAADLNRVSARDPFALLSLFVGGPEELKRYAAGAVLQTDDRMALEFSGPRALYNGAGRDNASTLRHLRQPEAAPPAIRRAWDGAGAAQWRNRAAMLASAADHASAYQDYSKSVLLDPADTATLDGLIRTAVVIHRETEALDRLRSSVQQYPRNVGTRIALSKLLATTGAIDEAIAVASEARTIGHHEGAALEQLASVLSDIGDARRLDEIVSKLRLIQPNAARTYYYAAATRFLHGQFDEAVSLARQAVALDPEDAAAHSLVGSSYASLGQRDAARQAFEASLGLDPRDSSTYVNLGILELASGNPKIAEADFAEALSLDPGSAAARQGLAQARTATTPAR